MVHNNVLCDTQLLCCSSHLLAVPQFLLEVFESGPRKLHCMCHWLFYAVDHRRWGKMHTSGDGLQSGTVYGRSSHRFEWPSFHLSGHSGDIADLRSACTTVVLSLQITCKPGPPSQPHLIPHLAKPCQSTKGGLKILLFSLLLHTFFFVFVFGLIVAFGIHVYVLEYEQYLTHVEVCEFTRWMSVRPSVRPWGQPFQDP